MWCRVYSARHGGRDHSRQGHDDGEDGEGLEDSTEGDLALVDLVGKLVGRELGGSLELGDLVLGRVAGRARR